MTLTKLSGAALAAALLCAAPAAAQDKPDRSRAGRVAVDIARTIEDTADAVGTVADSLDRSLGGLRFRSAERFAISRCAPRVARYGRMRVEHVEPYGRRSLRVYGVAEPGSWDSPYGRSRARSFACTVRDDGRVRLRTRRLA